MKLELRRLVRGARLGILSGLGGGGQHSLELPGCLLYTRCCSVPHLTQDTLRTLGALPAGALLPLASVAEHQEVLESFQEGAAKFAGLHNTALFCSLHDPATLCPSGYNTNKTVSIWSSGGRIELTVQRYMALQAAVRPNWYQSLADGDTQQAGTSLKRIRKSVDRTLAFLDECLLLHHKAQELAEAHIFGVIEGGDVLEERLRSSRETAKRPVSGFVLDGFHSRAMERELQHQLIVAVTSELPQDKPRLLQGVGRPDEVLACVELGVDLFEGFFPFLVTERGCALNFDFNVNCDPESKEQEENGVAEKLMKDSEEPADLQQVTCFEMNLKDEKYRDDFRPLVEGCECYCCKNHKRAYLHHLLVTKELLAGVLLMLHNLAHYGGFFSALRRALESGHFEALKGKVLGLSRSV
ncbi:queuine tRNA-ribosyltransferase accessory subunit 2 isoform X1 [Paramormyrops kingsleyae]|uniref:queuine tRNA-ribosyltransferase accessory subunit 2 isoform X1 n=1 Tax=Paramormyrops kingsleyae TaxID=1676925 RepID=UPI000CD62728|nr:queuine tRNA-ribosyltransferase accessory subunit 2 isoform X1 [Paramormyrops kingsleyae]